METVTSRSAEHQVYGPNLDSMMGQNQIMGQNQTSDPTTWVNRTPPNKNKSLLVGHVTVGGSPRLQVRFSVLKVLKYQVGPHSHVSQPDWANEFPNRTELDT